MAARVEEASNQIGQGVGPDSPRDGGHMVVACKLATDGVDVEDLDEPLTALQYGRLTVYIIMVFNFCTMLWSENLLGLSARDVFFPPVVGANATLKEHCSPM